MPHIIQYCIRHWKIQLSNKYTFKKIVYDIYARVVELVDTQDLDNLSALLEMIDVEFRKVGEGLTANTEPSSDKEKV